MSALRPRNQAVAKGTAPEGAAVGHRSASIVDAPGLLHDVNEIEKADEVAILVKVPSTGRSEQHVIGKLSKHPNPSRLIPQPCTDPACADTAAPSCCPVSAQILHSSPQSH